MYKVAEVLLLMLKGYECVQTWFCAYVIINEKINWRAGLVSDGAFFTDYDIFDISSGSCSFQTKRVFNIR